MNIIKEKNYVISLTVMDWVHEFFGVLFFITLHFWTRDEISSVFVRVGFILCSSHVSHLFHELFFVGFDFSRLNIMS